MKKLIPFLFLLGIVAVGIAASLGPLQVTNTTAELPFNSQFFPRNSNALVRVLGTSLSANNVLTVSPGGDDASAISGNPTKPFATMRAAFSNAPNNSIVRIMPGNYALTPLYTRPDDISLADLVGIPGLLRNKTNVTVIGDGVVITGPGTGCYIGISNCKNISIQGIEFNLTKGVGTEINDSYCGTVQNYGTNSNLNFERLRILNATNQGLTGSRMCYGLTVRNSYFKNIGSTNVTFVIGAVQSPYVDGTAISGLGSDTLISDCVFESNYRDCEWDGVSGLIVHSGFHVRNCTFSNYLHTSVFAYDANTNQAGLRNISIVNCDFQPEQTDMAVNSRDNALQINGAIWLNCGENITIANNRFFNLFDSGVRLSASSPMENIAISGNVFKGSSLGRTNLYNIGIVTINNAINATNPYALKGINITGNQFADLGGSALHVMGGNINVRGNQAWNVGKQAGGLYAYQIGGGGGASNVCFSGNVYSDDRSAFRNHGVAVNNLSKKVMIGRDNVLMNVDTAQSTSPMSVNSGANAEVFADGKTFVGTLSGSGTLTVTYPLIHTTSRVMVTRQATGGTPGHLSVSRTAETSFTVTSSSASDTSTVAVTIFEDSF